MDLSCLKKTFDAIASVGPTWERRVLICMEVQMVSMPVSGQNKPGKNVDWYGMLYSPQALSSSFLTRLVAPPLSVQQ